MVLHDYLMLLRLLGEHFGAFGSLGATLGSLCGTLGRLWAHFGALWGHLEPLWVDFGVTLSQIGPL